LIFEDVFEWVREFNEEIMNKEQRGFLLTINGDELAPALLEKHGKSSSYRNNIIWLLLPAA